ncbi:16720_t:CDS:2, partial [Acaulospora morrowiae]
KVDIIRRKDADVKLSDEKLAVEFGVERFTISSILRNKEKFLQLHADAKSLRSQNIPVSQDLLKMKAVELYNKAIEQGIQFPNFEASNGESICLNQVENGRKELQQIIATFNIDNVYNTDETGLFFRLGPNKTLASKGDKAKVSQWIHELNKGQKIKKPNIKEAIEIVADAWDNVKQETIKNCWLSTEILTAEMTHANTDNMKTDEADNNIVELILALDSLSIAEPSIDNLTANEYIEINNNLVSAEFSTDDKLVEEILLAEGVLHLIQVDMKDSSKEEETSIFVKVGREALVTVRKFLEQREFTTESDIRYICNIIKHLDKTLYPNLRYILKNLGSQSGNINK